MYPQLRENSKCITCLGCNRLELEEFIGVLRCENYIKGDKEDVSREECV